MCACPQWVCGVVQAVARVEQRPVRPVRMFRRNQSETFWQAPSAQLPRGWGFASTQQKRGLLGMVYTDGALE